MAGIAGADRRANRRVAQGCAQVGVRARCSRGCRGALHRRLHGQFGLGTGNGAQPVIADGHPGQGDIARIRDLVSPGDRLAGDDGRTRGDIRVLAVGVLGQLEGRFDAKVVAGIAIRHLVAQQRLPAHRGGICVLTRERAARRRTDHRFVRRQRRLRANDSAHLIVVDGHGGQGDIARVGDRIRPGHLVANPDIRAGRRVGVLAVGPLLNRYRRRHPIVVAGVAGVDGGQGGRRIAAGRAQVGVRPGDRGPAGRTHSRLAGVQGGLWTGDRHPLVVADDQVGQGDVAAVGDLVGPVHRGAGQDPRPGRLVGIHAPSAFLQAEGQVRAKIVAGVGGRDEVGTAQRIGRGRGLVGVGAGDSRAGGGAGHRFVDEQQAFGTTDRHPLVVDHRHVDQLDIAGVG